MANNDTYMVIPFHEDWSPDIISFRIVLSPAPRRFRLTLNTSDSNGTKFISVWITYNRGATWNVLTSRYPITGSTTIFDNYGQWDGIDPFAAIGASYLIRYNNEYQTFVDGVLVSLDSQPKFN